MLQTGLLTPSFGFQSDQKTLYPTQATHEFWGGGQFRNPEDTQALYAVIDLGPKLILFSRWRRR